MNTRIDVRLNRFYGSEHWQQLHQLLPLTLQQLLQLLLLTLTTSTHTSK